MTAFLGEDTPRKGERNISTTGPCAGYAPGVPDADDPDAVAQRTRALADLERRVCACTRCPAPAAARTRVVFGSGSPDAELMFVGEAPGIAEDRLGSPLAGAAGRLLDELLAGIGLTRDAVAVITLIRCRPPDNRAPLAAELDACQEHLFAQLELVRPAVVCPLGNAATRRLRGDTARITAVRGVAEVWTVGPRTVRLYPLVHPAAALYSPEGVELLTADVARIPALLAQGAPAQPEPAVAHAHALDAAEPVSAAVSVSDDGQLGLF